MEEKKEEKTRMIFWNKTEKTWNKQERERGEREREGEERKLKNDGARIGRRRSIKVFPCPNRDRRQFGHYKWTEICNGEIEREREREREREG